MEKVILKWNEQHFGGGSKAQINLYRNKDVVETTLALQNFKACDCVVLFLFGARGKVAEGIDFDRQYGRASNVGMLSIH